ncbi:universal stress protein [Oceanidesulfovibrio indonesiensis]|uniref:Universal stress protein n=1 Tax=Oceanidesulfovibrio indonesiensis TaxID=54767 RepID=A0A7M3MC84_9BACT|nr:universal stress protein [Oceanidesulfovibrio indonesiensis]TVM15398.1 universal stress protein [Oceanidesulfovibrio indonesiensis]
MKQVKKILCAVDFSEFSPVVAETAKTMAQAFDAEIIVLYAAPSLSQYVGFHVPPTSIENFVGEIVTGAEKSMDNFLAEHFEGSKAAGKVATGYAAEEIIKVAKDEKADLIVMGTHGRTGIDLILFGSVAEKVVKSSPIPVLTVRPEK